MVLDSLITHKFSQCQFLIAVVTDGVGNAYLVE